MCHYASNPIGGRSSVALSCERYGLLSIVRPVMGSNTREFRKGTLWIWVVVAVVVAIGAYMYLRG